MICSNCGNTNSEHAYVCGKCGSTMNSNSRRDSDKNNVGNLDTRNFSSEVNNESDNKSTLKTNNSDYLSIDNLERKKKNGKLILLFIAIILLLFALIPLFILVFNALKGVNIIPGRSSSVVTTPIEGWILYSDNEGGFDISFPSNPARSSDNIYGDIISTLYTSYNPQTQNQYTLSWVNFPNDIDISNPRSILNAESDKLKNQDSISIISNKNLDFKTYSAIEYEYKKKDVDGNLTYIKALSFIGHSKLFELSVDSKEENNYSNFDDYINSFNFK